MPDRETMPETSDGGAAATIAALVVVALIIIGALYLGSLQTGGGTAIDIEGKASLAVRSGAVAGDD